MWFEMFTENQIITLNIIMDIGLFLLHHSKFTYSRWPNQLYLDLIFGIADPLIYIPEVHRPPFLERTWSTFICTGNYVTWIKLSELKALPDKGSRTRAFILGSGNVDGKKLQLFTEMEHFQSSGLAGVVLTMPVIVSSAGNHRYSPVMSQRLQTFWNIASIFLCRYLDIMAVTRIC